MIILQLAIIGGLLSILTFIHFAVDWIFQTHTDAMQKHNNWRVRAGHCAIYTLGFVPLLLFCDFGLLEWLGALNILFWSHFIEDTYWPVFLWAKYIRKPPEMENCEDEAAGFLQFVSTPTWQNPNDCHRSDYSYNFLTAYCLDDFPAHMRIIWRTIL